MSIFHSPTHTKCWSITQDCQGSATPILLLAMMMVLGFASLLLDLSKINAAQEKLNMASELAAQAMAKNMHLLNEQDLHDLGRDVLIANLQSSTTFFGNDISALESSVSFDQNPVSGELTIEVEAKVGTYLLRIFHLFEDIEIAKTVSVRQIMPEAELVMVLDSSLEMAVSGKLSEVKLWSAEFVKAFSPYAKINNGIQFALVPFGGSFVNVAPHKNWVEDGSWPEDVPPNVPGTKAWSGALEQERWCVDQRSGRAGETDILPANSKFPLVIGISSANDPKTGVPHFSVTTTPDCSGVSLVPLADSPSVLTENMAKIIGIGESGAALGMIWAERMLSPKWRSVWSADSRHPVAYHDPEVEKIVLLIAGSGVSSSDDQGLLLSTTCNRLKSNGVKIFVVEYLVAKAMAAPLKNCATSTGYYFKVSSGIELRETLWLIVKFIGVVTMID